MSSDVLFTERTADGDDTMEIDGEEIAETEAAAVAEEEDSRLRALDLSSLHRVAKVRENKDICGGGRGGVEGERMSKVRPLLVLCYHRNMVIYHYPLVGVIFMVILYVFIIKSYPNLLPNYYPKYIFRVIYPFYAFRKIYIQIHFT